VNAVTEFMEQLFPVKSLNKYMWEHLASCLIGTNNNQTFNIYLGSGSNGKSKLMDLMTYALGDYKGTVPITLITEKRNSIGGTSSEVMALKGLRYAVMQEPSKDMKINEGVLKELTGGDPLQARSLFQESEIFIPQFKLVVCTNCLFDVNSNDDGTWRRMRVDPFSSKFVDPQDMGNHPDAQYLFPKDKKLEDKLILWASTFSSMLVHKAFLTEGAVEDCDIVLSATNKYRRGQDNIKAFIDEKVKKTDDPADKIKQKDLAEEFKLWFQINENGRKMPRGKELTEMMNKMHGTLRDGKWSGVKILFMDISEDISLLN